MKKTVSIITVIIMLISICSFSASAASFVTEDYPTLKEESTVARAYPASITCINGAVTYSCGGYDSTRCSVYFYSSDQPWFPGIIPCAGPFGIIYGYAYDPDTTYSIQLVLDGTITLAAASYDAP